jgi:aminoglycoside phosphotransferase family enzyme
VTDVTGEPKDDRVLRAAAIIERRMIPYMFDTRLIEKRVTEADVRDFGDLMARFYRNCTPGIADSDLYPKHLATEQAINRTVLERIDLDVGDSARPALDAVDRALETFAPRIGQRIADGLVVEGHGDLRPEHVHLGLV